MTASFLPSRHRLTPQRVAAAVALSACAVISLPAQATTPAAPVSASVDVAGQPMAYMKYGQGEPVLIVHGIGGHKEDWTGLVQALAPTRTAYAVDMIGFGASGKTAPAINITLQAEALKALMDQQGLKKASLVGNSLGAWVVVTFATRYPDRVERLVLSDAAGLKVTLSGPPPVNFAPETVDEMQKLLQTVLASPWAQGREFAEKALAGFKASGEKETLAKLFAGFADKGSADKPLDDLLPQVKAPTLVVWGAKDGLFPAPLADMVVGGLTGAAGGASKVLIQNASHFPQLDNPAEFNAAVLQFLGRR
ncbi:MAG: alpha/beta fold hydrolase [Burkholderiales bacterium]|uniref:alpha/beta fold hydrolase n=1 Tax=Roseateles sp. TaxID=1971397 RepID=UPI000FAA93DC|nr:MAG: alpha/beta fold hydrolase [Burkholderiales bacterium]